MCDFFLEFGVMAIVVFSVFPFINSVIVVVLIQYVFVLYSEIQSWEVAFVVFHFFITVFGFVHWMFENKNETVNKLELYIFTGFGLSKEELEGLNTEGLVFHYVFSSLVPTLVVGYVANWFWESRLVLECSLDYASTNSSFCTEDGSCCHLVNIQQDITSFISICLGAIVGGYQVTAGVVKFMLQNMFIEIAKPVPTQ